GGIMDVNGNDPQTDVTVNTGTLGGTGTVGKITETSTAANTNPAGPGATGELDAVGPVVLDYGSFSVDLKGHSLVLAYDFQLVTSTANINGATLHINSAALMTPANTTFTILTAQGGLTGTFLGLPNGATVPGTNFKITYTATSVILTQLFASAAVSVT